MLLRYYRAAYQGKWLDDETILNSGGYKRKQPDWASMSPTGKDRQRAEMEEQRRLLDANRDRIRAIHDRLRSEGRVGG